MIHFQPIVDISSRTLFAEEALTRCTRSDYANPESLFARASAEHSNGRLGRMVREKALAERRTGRMFVNIHPDELSSRWLVRPDDPIATYPGTVFLEITEAATLEYFDLCQSVLREISNRIGAVIVVDDLGAGYSNLMRIVDLQPGFVKLDRDLIRGLDQEPRRQIVVRSLVRLCTELKAWVIAEGIETVEELKACRDCGVRYIQGFLFGRPSPNPEVNWPEGY